MDDREIAVARKLENLLKQAAVAAVELSRLNDAREGVPHYSAIELHAHELGKRLSREIQRREMDEVSADQLHRCPCPTCKQVCDVSAMARSVSSIDGPLDLQEVVGYCPRCRRSFFPESGRAWV